MVKLQVSFSHVPVVCSLIKFIRMEWDFATGFIHYGPDWRIHRRLFNQMFRPAAVTKYRPLQTKKVTEFLYALLTTPEDFEEHSKKSVLVSRVNNVRHTHRCVVFQEVL